MDLPTYLSGNVQTKAYRILRQEVYAVLSRYDLIPTQWAMLGIILGAKDGIRQSDIAKALDVKPPLVTMMFKNLNERKLIESATNQFDTRSKLLIVTQTGKRFIKNVEKDLHLHLEKLLNGLNETDMIAYHKVLETIIINKSRNLS